MIENLNFILKVIESDIFLSYFYYTLLFIIVSLFLRDKRKYKLDDIFTTFLIHSGILFIGIIIIKSVLVLIISDSPNRTEEFKNMFGKNWIGYWFIPLIHLFLTQLLRLNKIKRYILPRLILVLLLAFTWERYSGFLAYENIRYMESFGPEYKSNALEKFTPFFIFKHISLRIIIYGVLAFTYYEVLKLIKKTFYNNV